MVMRWTDNMNDGISYKDFYEKLDLIHKDITDIKIQTTKTNGRVTACEVKFIETDKKLENLKQHNKDQDQKIVDITIKYGVIYGIITLIIFIIGNYIVPNLW